MKSWGVGHDDVVPIVPPGSKFTRVEAWTMAFTFFPVAITVSVVHSTAGTAPWVIMSAAFFINSATATLSYAAVTAAGGGTLAGVLGGWLVTTRFGLLAAAISPRLWPSRWKRAAAALYCLDPNVTLALREEDDTNVRRVYFASTIWMLVPWWAGSAVGILIGDLIGDPQRLGFDAIFPALFVAIIWPQLKNRTTVTICLLGAVIALALVEPAPGGIPVLLGAAAALLAIKDVERC